MNLIAIGDVHGRDAWKQANINEADRVIFLGDYTDNRYEFSDEEIYQNLEEIIKLKRSRPNKVVLLLGNHDAHYLHFPKYGCDSSRPSAQPALTALFIRHKSLFQIAYQKESYLFTHAGVSKHWYEYRKPYLEQTDANTTLADQLNSMHQNEKTSPFLFEVGPRRGGHNRYSGPIWADRSETRDDYLPGYHQVVGHTPITKITTFGNESGSITYCDVTQTIVDFFEVTL